LEEKNPNANNKLGKLREKIVNLGNWRFLILGDYEIFGT
jgi:hypothetical protein